MGRQARQISSTGFYHIVFRGVNHHHIFEEDRDDTYFLQILSQLKQDMGFAVHAYCLMSNHVHLLLKENQLGDVSLIMKRLLTKYAMYFNRKYQRSGALVASRYKSLPVAVDEYFIPLQRYIHQNPLRAGLVVRAEDYPFSSYRDFIQGGGLTDTEFSLSLVGRDEWLRLHRTIGEEVFEVTGQKLLSDAAIRQQILRYTHGREPQEIGSWDRSERDALLRQLKEQAGLSIRQIERATGISRGVVARC